MKNNKKLTPFRKEEKKIVTWVIDHKKMVMPVILVICIIITAVITIKQSTKVPGTDEKVSLASDSAASEISIPDVALEENAYPEVNSVINQYYTAYAEGDMDTIESISSGISDTRKLRIEESAKYIESIPTVDVYTKPGPVDGSYIAYIYEEIKFTDYDTSVPGMESMYICTKDDGTCYINFVDDSSVSEYIRQISLEDDVVDLNNRVSAAYNEMVASDDTLSTFLTNFSKALNEAVGETIASSTASSDVSSDSSSAASSDSVSSASSDSSAVASSVASTDSASASSAASTTDTVTKLEATDVVNIRKSDSEKADVLGKTEVGTKYVLVESKDNGWSKIEYDGGTAFVKTEYFKSVTETASDNSSAASSQTAKADTTSTTTSSDAVTTNGTKYVKTTSRVRKSASTDSEVIATAYEGDSIKVTNVRADGWSKVEYSGKTGYIKTEYLKN